MTKPTTREQQLQQARQRWCEQAASQLRWYAQESDKYTRDAERAFDAGDYSGRDKAVEIATRNISKADGYCTAIDHVLMRDTGYTMQLWNMARQAKPHVYDEKSNAAAGRAFQSVIFPETTKEERHAE